MAPPDEQFKSLLSALDERGGKLTRSALAHSLGLPLVRVASFVAAARRVLNVEGYAVVRFDEPSDTIELNLELLIAQFELQSASGRAAMISPERRNEVIDALRRGTVPQRSLDAFAVGLQPFEAVIGEELESVRRGRAQFKAVRGEYGSGKTFFARWLQERAKRLGFATAEVQISETETPLHRVETVYRRLMERLATGDSPSGAFRSIVDGWFFALEQDVLAEGTAASGEEPQLIERTNALMEQRLAEITKQAPAFAATLRAYRSALASNDTAMADGLLAWLAGQPNVSASVKRSAGVKGDIDHFGALSFLQGLLVVLRDSGHAGSGPGAGRGRDAAASKR